MRQKAGDRILVIDAQAETRRHVCDYLARLGYQADGAGCGGDAQVLLNRSVYDAVLFDLADESAGGVGFREILADHPDVTVIVMSASPSVKGVIASLRGGAFDYIIKPYEIQDLTLLLPRAVERSQENRRRRELCVGSTPGTGETGGDSGPSVVESVGSGRELTAGD